ncbi:MAG TPA: hypothetical protein DDX19_12620 [Rhodopirellula baltica]|nr:hypothetical protein [Rhodopirellula baltica]
MSRTALAAVDSTPSGAKPRCQLPWRPIGFVQVGWISVRLSRANHSGMFSGLSWQLGLACRKRCRPCSVILVR